MLRPILIIIGFGIASIPILSLMMVLFALTPEQMKALALFNGLLIYGLFVAPAIDAVIRQRLEDQKKKDEKHEDS